jgi:hypothetical protein
MRTNFLTHLFCCCFWIQDPGWVKIRIRDKHPGSETVSHVGIFNRLCELGGSMGSYEGRGPLTDKTPAAKSLYRSIFLGNDIRAALLSICTAKCVPSNINLSAVKAKYGEGFVANFLIKTSSEPRQLVSEPQHTHVLHS